MEWRDIPGYSLYEASESGEIRNKKTHKVVNPFFDRLQEYGRITVYKNGKKGKIMAHHLIALAFLGPKPEGLEVDHINSDRNDNRPANLRYVTREENYKNPNTIAKRKARFAKFRQLTLF